MPSLPSFSLPFLSSPTSFLHKSASNRHYILTIIYIILYCHVHPFFVIHCLCFHFLST
ncbi:hypothetical protein Lalb_Chr16g0384981 [Lupinus albus]|uniref:Uncharacterized protein n=1 Tax=Lupinus albus TaxID=3870 RepID=A0A6A4P6C2_LUPAL|nr:hypothetical protein Lalb_Chr16g0384981 [Lupinus albus]